MHCGRLFRWGGRPISRRPPPLPSRARAHGPLEFLLGPEGVIGYAAKYSSTGSGRGLGKSFRQNGSMYELDFRERTRSIIPFISSLPSFDTLSSTHPHFHTYHSSIHHDTSINENHICRILAIISCYSLSSPCLLFTIQCLKQFEEGTPSTDGQ